jgi:predicted amidohydrolase YtcJ
VVDLGGRFLMPGFVDAHVHFIDGGQHLTGIGLRDATTMAEVQRRVAAYAKEHPEKKWLLGEAWSYGYPDMPNGEFHKEMLDKVVSDRPVFLSSDMAHAAWAEQQSPGNRWHHEADA